MLDSNRAIKAREKEVDAIESQHRELEEQKQKPFFPEKITFSKMQDRLRRYGDRPIRPRTYRQRRLAIKKYLIKKRKLPNSQCFQF